MNNKYNSFKAAINRMLEDGYKKIEAKHLFTYSFGDVELIEKSIQKWEDSGEILILKPYKDCRSDEYCIELFRFIEQKSPIEGYLNWE